MAAVCGPILSPVIGGFAVMKLNWRWSIYELIFASGFSLAFSVSCLSRRMFLAEMNRKHSVPKGLGTPPLIRLCTTQFVFLPETYGPTILRRRALRLRKATGNEKLITREELDLRDEPTIFKTIWTTISRAFLLCADPIVFFVNMYLAFVCE